MIQALLMILAIFITFIVTILRYPDSEKNTKINDTILENKKKLKQINYTVYRIQNDPDKIPLNIAEDIGLLIPPVITDKSNQSNKPNKQKQDDYIPPPAPNLIGQSNQSNQSNKQKQDDDIPPPASNIFDEEEEKKMQLSNTKQYKSPSIQNISKLHPEKLYEILNTISTQKYLYFQYFYNNQYHKLKIKNKLNVIFKNFNIFDSLENIETITYNTFLEDIIYPIEYILNSKFKNKNVLIHPEINFHYNNNDHEISKIYSMKDFILTLLDTFENPNFFSFQFDIYKKNEKMIVLIFLDKNENLLKNKTQYININKTLPKETKNKLKSFIPLNGIPNKSSNEIYYVFVKKRSAKRKITKKKK